MLEEKLLLDLSPTQARILRLVDADYSIAEIAADLNYTLPTIYYHLKNLCRKFDVNNRQELLLCLHRQAQPKTSTYKSPLIDVDLAPDHYRNKLFYKQKRMRIVNTVYKLKYRCNETWISSKREWQRELDDIVAVIIKELT